MQAWCIIISFLVALLSRVKLNLLANEYIWSDIWPLFKCMNTFEWQIRVSLSRGRKDEIWMEGSGGPSWMWYQFSFLQMDSILLPISSTELSCWKGQGEQRDQKEPYIVLSSSSFSHNYWHFCNIVQIKYERKYICANMPFFSRIFLLRK